MTGERLRSYMKVRGIKVSWLAKQLDITNAAMYYKLSGKTSITIENAADIRKVCRMTQAEFNSVFCEEKWFGLVS